MNNGTLTVVQVPLKPILTVVANNCSKIYGSANPTFNTTITGFINGDSAAVVTGLAAASTTASNTSSVGTYLIKPSLGTLNSANYAFVFADGNLTVTKATPVITWANPTGITEGTPLGTNELNAIANTPGSFNYLPTGGTVLSVGSSQVLSATFQPDDGTNYTATISSVLVNVLPVVPAITAGPGSVTVLVTSNATFNVSASGTAPLGYQWFFNATNVLAAATNASLTVTNAQSANAGGYSVVVTNVAGSVGSVVATLTVLVPPSITAQPANLTVNALTDAGFTVSAAGTLPLTYRWEKDGVAVGGATSAALTLNAVTTNQAGGYRVVITNVAGVVTSSVAGLTVNRLVPGLTWNTPGAITYGTALGGAQLNAGAGVAGSYAYSPAAGTLLGAGTRALNVTFTPSDGSVHVPNTAGVSLAVNPAGLTVTAQNQSRLYGTGNPALTVSYSGFVNGETAAVLTSAPVAATVATVSSVPGSYPITVSGASGANYAITHVNGVLTVTADGPAITVQPTNAVVILGSNAVFSMTATGTGPLAYQWFFNATNVLAGATNTTLYLTNTLPTSAGNYTVVVTNVAGSVTSAVAMLTVLVPPSITAQPLSQTVSVGQNISFTMPVTGTAPFYYQWRKDGLVLSGQNANSLALANVIRAQSGLYSVVVSNAVGTVTSINALLRVLVPQRFATNSMKWLGDGRFRLVFGDYDGGPLTIGDTTNFVVETSTNFVNWVPLTNAFTMTNGQVQMDDTGSINLPRRFYRVLER